MVFDRQFKERVLQVCEQQLTDKKEDCKHRIEILKDSLSNESKSTAGDKHETGRAMIHLELEKTGTQLNRIEEGIKILNRINAERKSTASLGALVETEKGVYFISLSLGEVDLSGEKVYVVSPASPIGALLLGKKKGSKISFQGQQMTLLQLY